MFELTIKTGFESAHKIGHGYQGKCSKIHGHNWKVELTIAVEKLNQYGMAMDFADIKKIAHTVIDQLDHQNLNQQKYFKKNNPTAEHIAKYIFDNLKKKFLVKRAQLKKIAVWETEKYCAVYREDSSY